MLITAVCPACQTSYQVQPTLRGQSMRCPNARCRKVFVVPADPTDKPSPANKPAPEVRKPAPAKPQRSGTVGEMVPILPAEEIGPPATAEPQPKTPSWLDAPPVIRQGNKVAPSPNLLEDAAPSAPAPSWDAPPPVRRSKEPAVAEERAAPKGVESTEPVAAKHETPEPAPRRGRGKTYAAIAFLLLLVIAGLGAGAFLVWNTREKEKSKRFDEALKAYKDGGFREAADKFHDLQQTDDDRKDDGRFYEALARLRAELYELPPAGADKLARTAASLQQLADFIKENQGKKLLNDNAHDLGETLVKVVDDFAKAAVPASSDAALALVDQVRSLKEQVVNLNDGLSSDDSTKIDAELAKVEKSVTGWQQRGDARARLKKLTANPSVATIRKFLQVLKKEEETFPELAQEPAVAEMKTQLYEGHFASIVYQEDGAELARPDSHESPPTAALAVTPLVRGSAAPAWSGLDFVTARGVVYALERGTGEFRWALRVGLESNRVPLRLHGTAAERERFLILADDATVAQVVDDDGAILWRYRLDQPCLGKPLLIDQRVLLPTVDGVVHVLDLARGRIQGRYRLGQRLSVGGARQEGTPLVYFPADDSCVYVLDVDKHLCVGILYTGHPAGSLRSVPLIVAAETPGRMNSSGFLILNQSAGVDETQLRVFALPTSFPVALADRLVAPLKLDHDLRLRGWSWFTPYADDEKLAVVTDAGRFYLFGVKQPENEDPPLFPLLSSEPGGYLLDRLLPPEGAGRGRAQVVYARGEDFWVLANGKLQCLQFGWNARGRALLPGWKEPLGLPLQAAQVTEDHDSDRALLLLATQPLTQRVCLATAVAAESGAIRWQRQLGMVCQGEPLVLGEADDRAPLLLAVDRAGALFAFDPLQSAKLAPGLTQSGGVRVAGTVDDNPVVPPVLLAGPDRLTAYEVACPGQGRQVLIRQVHFDAAQRQMKMDKKDERLLSLPAPLGGVPAVVGARLLLPLENGRLVFVKLPLDGAEPRPGANWRDARLGSSTHGHVVSLGPDHYLTTDGQRSVTVWHWPFNEPLPVGKRMKKGAVIPVTFELKAALAAAPLVLPKVKDLPLRVCVVDIEGWVTLLDVRPNGELIPSGAWELHGRVTAGPFLRTVADGTLRIACVLDERKLAWLDPAHDGKSLWEYKAAGPIIGSPHLIEGVLVVALRSGAFLGLDPATGKVKGATLQSPGELPPAISPVAFGSGRLFAPLADGTILLPNWTR